MSLRTLILQAWSHKEQKKGRAEEDIAQPGNCPVSPVKLPLQVAQDPLGVR